MKKNMRKHTVAFLGQSLATSQILCDRLNVQLTEVVEPKTEEIDSTLSRHERRRLKRQKKI